tara:strand:- start:3183 stop:3410 length:228 start_codon:yes stop_codon:yes gene_type:complete
MNLKIGDHVQIRIDSEYFESQSFDTFRRHRTFVIVEIVHDEYVCESIVDGYTNTYEEHDLVKVSQKKYNKRTLNL